MDNINMELGSCRVATQLVVSRVVLRSIELVSYVKLGCLQLNALILSYTMLTIKRPNFGDILKIKWHLIRW
jgi:hypothetical protein